MPPAGWREAEYREPAAEARACPNAPSPVLTPPPPPFFGASLLFFGLTHAPIAPPPPLFRTPPPKASHQKPSQVMLLTKCGEGIPESATFLEGAMSVATFHDGTTFRGPKGVLSPGNRPVPEVFLTHGSLVFFFGVS